MIETYKKQVALLIRVLPIIAKEKRLALHGGSAINLFVKEMPRLSVDIDMTYLPIKNRKDSLLEIRDILENIKEATKSRIDGVLVKGPTEQENENKLICSLKGIQIKIEVNTLIRGSLGEPELKEICKTAQKEFNLFAEITVIPFGQLYGGKICAALDRQHPRDIFDIKYLPLDNGINDDLKYGFIFSLLGSARPIHEILNPSRLDHRITLERHFSGMTRESFTYEDFEDTREKLVIAVNDILTVEDKEFLLSFKDGVPDWCKDPFKEFKIFPAIKWKLININNLKRKHPDKHKLQFGLLKEQLNV